jgi:hypothetical protein
MAKTHYGKTIAMDAIGIVKPDRLKISTIELVPNAAGDTATFKCWYDSGLHSTACKEAVVVSSGVVTVHPNDMFTAGKVTASDVIYFTEADLAANQGVIALVSARGGDDNITVGPTTSLTDDAAGIYSWKIYTPVQELIITADGTTGAKSPTSTWLNGRWFNNLVLTQLSTSAKVYIYYD